jgi:DNA repair exonuclease SbcCD nuclease subunit
VRILFLSDTHLGLDLPSRPRIDRRRRGDDLFESFERALAPVTTGEAGVLIHGGDLFYRSLIPAWLAERVFSRLARLADAGVDVFWVPGNHERSGIPRGLLLTHPGIRVFDRPRTFVVRRDGVAVALAGFPCAPRVRTDFPSLLAATGHEEVPADVRVLCIHQAVEGATVGPVGFVFRNGPDVIRGTDVPAGFAAVLSGHIHRSQVLVRDLAGRPLAAPVLFAGSTDRTSFAERGEPKGTFVLEAGPGGAAGGGALTWEFRELPVRPMVVLDVDPARAGFEARLREALAGLDPSSIVRLRLASDPPPEALPFLRAGALRAAAPPGMSLSVGWPAPHSAFVPRRASTLNAPPPRQAMKRNRNE